MQNSPRNSQGLTISDPFAVQSGIVSVAAGAGVLGVAMQAVASWKVGPRSRLYLQEIGMRIVDMAGFDQIFFALRLNGSVLAPFDQINGEQMNDWHTLTVETEYGPGSFDISAINISGTDWPGAAGAGGAIRVICRAKGSILK